VSIDVGSAERLSLDIYLKLINIYFMGPFLNYWHINEPQFFSRSDVTESRFAVYVLIFLTSVDVV
jgi:hypothetical protein